MLLNNSLSGFSDVISGVPQGTVNGPLLFLILIDSMGELKINSLLLAFADDNKIVTKISSEADIHYMQAHMEPIYDWQASNNMKFNFGKFKWLQFGVRPKYDINYNYFGPEYNEIFVQSDEVKDLGVLISPDGSFDKHISAIISKVNKRIGLLIIEQLTS